MKAPETLPTERPPIRMQKPAPKGQTETAKFAKSDPCQCMYGSVSYSFKSTGGVQVHAPQSTCLWPHQRSESSWSLVPLPLPEPQMPADQ